MGIKCCNEKCGKDVPEYGAIVVTCDGDFVCNSKCKREWEAQRDAFFGSLSDPNFNLGGWLRGGSGVLNICMYR